MMNKKIEELNADKDAMYFYDQDSSVIVIGHVDISRSQLKELPVRFSVSCPEKQACSTYEVGIKILNSKSWIKT